MVDPHFDLPRVASAESDIRARDLLPFREAIRAGVASIMTSHTIYENLDPECPATLSKKILTGLLRNELGYDNVVITDDLEMGAIEEEGDLGEGALQALEAGADILLICHSHEKVIAAHDKTGLAVSESAKLQQRVKKSFQRVSLLKAEFAKSD